MWLPPVSQLPSNYQGVTDKTCDIGCRNTFIIVVRHMTSGARDELFFEISVLWTFSAECQNMKNSSQYIRKLSYSFSNLMIIFFKYVTITIILFCYVPNCVTELQTPSNNVVYFELAGWQVRNRYLNNNMKCLFSTINHHMCDKAWCLVCIHHFSNLSCWVPLWHDWWQMKHENMILWPWQRWGGHLIAIKGHVWYIWRYCVMSKIKLVFSQC